jgi:hypothetical protein
MKGKQAKTELQIKSLSSKLEMTQDEAVTQCNKAKSAEESFFSLKEKFHRAKEQLCRYKVKARSFFK